jgi:hypothetical protein
VACSSPQVQPASPAPPPPPSHTGGENAESSGLSVFLIVDRKQLFEGDHSRPPKNLQRLHFPVPSSSQRCLLTPFHVL